MFVHDRFYANALRAPGRPALVSEGCRFTYGEIASRAHGLARTLRGEGLQTGDRVAVDLANRPAAVVGIWGALTAGGAFVCLDPTTPSPRFLQLLEDFRPRVLLTRPERLQGLRRADLPDVVLCDGEDPTIPGVGRLGDLPATPVQREAFATPWLEDAGGDLLASLVYTSGSTGFPKGVMMTHRSVGAAAGAITTYLRSSQEDVVLCVLPLSFDYGHYQVLLTGLTGGCLVLEPGFGYPGDLLSLLRREGVTTLPGVPTLFALLLRLKSFRSEELPRLRVLTNTGAAVPVPHVRELRRRFPAARLYLMYGLTECKRVSYLPPEDVDRYPDSVGIPMPGCEVAIVDDRGERVHPGEVGELVIRGDNLMTGYWERPEATAQRIRPGPWGGEPCLYSGDLFRTNADGYLRFVGRRDDVFKCRGEKVAPSEVEHVLLEMEDVEQAAVVGMEHPMLGQAICAVVVPMEGATLTPAQVREHCSRNLETYKVPHEVIVVDALPRNSRGKVDKEALRGSLHSRTRGPV